LTEVTIYCPSGEIRDMKPTLDPTLAPSRKELHSTTFWLPMDMRGLTGVMEYSPLSLAGPSRSMARVLPSAEKEWQLAQT